ncbi:hypothetical protein BH10ACT3_BH10ACT3_22870 [soil metagenome]
MDLLDEESHRLLLWAVRLFEVGGTPTRKDLRRLSEPRRPAALAVVAGLSGRSAEFSEGALSSLVRRGLLDVVADDRLAPTELGRLVVNALGLHPEDAPLFEVLDTDLRSSDPLAFARVVGRIAALDRPMVVDPYCRRAQLEYLITHTSVNRVLVSDRLTAEDLDDLIDLIDSIKRRDTKLLLRVAPADAVHDRHVINGDRVLQVGGTLQSVGAGTTVLSEPIDLGIAAREYYRQVWKAARKLATYRPSRDVTRVA